MAWHYDHPRIKGIINALHKVLDKPQVRLLGNVDYDRHQPRRSGASLRRRDLLHGRRRRPRPGDPGIELGSSYGAGEFVAWYGRAPRLLSPPGRWRPKVAVIGVGNVALDVARVLAKTGDELPTEILTNVYEGLKANDRGACVDC